MTGAIALQLFVLIGQASWVPEVATTLRQPPWLTMVAASLGVGLAAITAGCALTRVGLLAVRARGRTPRGRTRPQQCWASRTLLALTMVLGGILLTGMLVWDASTSAYVQPASQPILHVVVRGDEIIAVEPTWLDGWHFIGYALQPTSAHDVGDHRCGTGPHFFVASSSGWVTHRLARHVDRWVIVRGTSTTRRPGRATSPASGRAPRQSRRARR